MKEKKKIAINIQSEVQFFSIEPLASELKKNKNYELHLLVDKMAQDVDGYKQMASGVAQLMKSKGYVAEPMSEYMDCVFDLFLTPYIDNNIKSKCYIKYEYGTLNIKPNLTYTPPIMEKFHGFLCQSTITKELLSVYGKTFAVDNLRFYKKKLFRGNTGQKSKKTILFAPTYNDNDNVDELIEIIKTLKERYHVVIKGHHGTQYLKRNAQKKQTLETLADEYYGPSTNLSDLILKADACLFGNSSAIAEAIYANVPCAIYSNDLDLFKLGDIHTTQYQIVKDGYILHCEEINKIGEMLELSMKKEYMNKEKELSDKLFPKEFHNGLEGYLEVIKYFLEDPLAQDYIKLHNYKIEYSKNEAKQQMNQIDNKEKELQECKYELQKCKNELEDHSKRKLYKIADKMYWLEGKIINGKN